MSRINSYLTFNGNCREAMHFYQKCLGGELSIQTIGQSPLAGKMPARMKEAILHATLTKGDMVIMASDMVDEKGLLKGNGISLMLECESKEEIYECYEKLSANGERTHPIEVSFWQALSGGLIDKYGHYWLLHYQIKGSSNVEKIIQADVA